MRSADTLWPPVATPHAPSPWRVWRGVFTRRQQGISTFEAGSSPKGIEQQYRNLPRGGSGLCPESKVGRAANQQMLTIRRSSCGISSSSFTSGSSSRSSSRSSTRTSNSSGLVVDEVVVVVVVVIVWVDVAVDVGVRVGIVVRADIDSSRRSNGRCGSASSSTSSRTATHTCLFVMGST